MSIHQTFNWHVETTHINDFSTPSKLNTPWWALSYFISIIRLWMRFGLGIWKTTKTKNISFLFFIFTFLIYNCPNVSFFFFFDCFSSKLSVHIGLTKLFSKWILLGLLFHSVTSSNPWLLLYVTPRHPHDRMPESTRSKTQGFAALVSLASRQVIPSR